MSINEQYQAVLADLQQMKADVEDGIRAIKRLMSRAAGVASRLEEVPAGAHQDNDSSLPTRIVSFLESRQGRTFRIAEIWEGLGKPNMPTLRGQEL